LYDTVTHTNTSTHSQAHTNTRGAETWIETGNNVKLARMTQIRKHIAECEKELTEITGGATAGGEQGAYIHTNYTDRLLRVVQKIRAFAAEYDQVCDARGAWGGR
jgi:hypothetical protein